MAVFSALAGLTLFGANVLGLSFAGATIFANVALGLGISALFSFASSIFTQAPAIRTPQAQAVINQSTGPRIRGYGRAMLGGTRAFFDSKDGVLYQVIMHHHGEIDAIESYRIGDITPTLDGSGDATDDALTWGLFSSDVAVRLISRLGTSGQAALSIMTGPWGSAWTSDHRLRGIAYTVARFQSPPAEEYQRIFPDGSNTPVRALCRLSKVLDPRTSSTAWSDNASLAIYDYLRHPDGYRLQSSDVDAASFAAFADICDQNVSLAAGGTEKRYRLWGVYQLTDQPHSVLRRMLNACDGELYQTPEGKIAIRGGAWEPPAITIAPEHILGHSLEQGNNRFAAFNELKVLYTSPQHDYQTMEATSWVDTADQAERGVIESEFDGDFIPSPSQARRCAKIFQHKANPRWKGRILTDAYGLNALGERVIRVVIPDLEIDEAFFVAGLRFSPDLASVEIEISSISQAAYEWDAATEEGANPAIPQDTAPDLHFPVPENLALSSPGTGVVFASVDPPTRTGLTLEAQIRAGAGANWIAMETESQTEARATGLPDGDYQVRARWAGAGNVAGNWTFPLAEITIPIPDPEPE